MDVMEKMVPLVEPYDCKVFHLQDYVPNGVDGKVEILPPAIDPLSPKNMALSPEDAAFVCDQFGVDVDRPLICQVSRFDPWKDPLGVIDCYRQLKDEVDGLQLALVGSMATDDPEGWDFFQMTHEHAQGDEDIKILNNLNNVGAIEVNAFQSQADVVMQKSIREGFGLTVSEALWKARPDPGRPDRLSGQLARRSSRRLPRDPVRPGGRQTARPRGEGIRPHALPHAAAAPGLAADLQRPGLSRG
jgi:trehalose synthase